MGKSDNNYYSLLNEMMEHNADSVDFIWNCRDGKIVTSGNRFLFPDCIENPFRYMAENGYVSRHSEMSYSAFCLKIEEGISAGTEDNSSNIDVIMSLLDNKAEWYHIYTDFMKDDEGKILAVHANIRLFSREEQNERNKNLMMMPKERTDLLRKHIIEFIGRDPSAHYAFVQFDIERFKLINDKYGGEVGDEILTYINYTMMDVCRNIPCCCINADVFMFVMPYETREDILEFVRNLEKQLLGYRDIEYHIVFGIAAIDKVESPSRRYGDNAAIARRSVKGNAMENIAFYEEKMMKELHKKQSIEYDMYKAVDNNEFLMYLQPKYCISTGKIIGAEALSRWKHPENGLISPAEYIPVFEKNGFIIKLDEIMWEHACRKIREWMDLGKEPVPISVNVSRHYLTDNKAVKILSSLVEKYNIPINYLELEITESAEISDFNDVIIEFKQKGFKMLMDDFGSGYSSLNMLKTTPFDVLKIDRAFLSEFMESERGRKIISHTISMSNDIGIDIIAEGVETSEQADFLNSCGCDAAQGFYYSKPIPEEEFDKIFF